MISEKAKAHRDELTKFRSGYYAPERLNEIFDSGYEFARKEQQAEIEFLKGQIISYEYALGINQPQPEVTEGE